MENDTFYLGQYPNPIPKPETNPNTYPNPNPNPTPQQSSVQIDSRTFIVGAVIEAYKHLRRNAHFNSLIGL